MQIKTLSEILAQMDEADLCAGIQSPKSNNPKNTPLAHNHSTKKSKKINSSPAPRRQKQTRLQAAAQTVRAHLGNNKSASHQTKHTQKAQSSDSIEHTDKIHTSAAMNEKMLQLLQNVKSEAVTDNLDKATRYMRWLAFYYLSNRELSQHQLRQKLLDKGCDADAVKALTAEFAKKGYQSDERCAQMIIRESIRKNRGKQHILRALKSAQISLSGSLDEQMAQAGIDTLTDATALEGDKEVDWLRLAVEARCKKYGDSPPSTPKEKAKQFRFLQYRGFDTSVCFDALKYSLEDFG